MTEQTGGIVLKESRGLSIGSWLTYARALLSQSAANLVQTDDLPANRCVFFIELGHRTPRLRANGEDDWVELNEGALPVLADAARSGKVDLILTDAGCIDLTFDMPPGPLPEVSAMIDAEILYRSPFAEDSTLAIWEAHEAANGGWTVTAAVTLEPPVQAIVAQLATHNLEIASVIRDGENGKTLRTAPPWKRAARVESPSPIAVFRSLAPNLQAALAGAVIFTVSATAHWGNTVFSDWSLNDDARQAQTELRSTAAASARLRGLDGSLAQSSNVLALTGTLSQALPDDVWLDQIVIDDADVTLVGFAPSAADVTRILTELGALDDIRFASPVIRDNTQSIERFRIAATLSNGDTE
ncbi:MAG: PilN domain-containing protein [Pseudomonadota bacterium]